MIRWKASIFLHVLAMVSEMERDLISVRTKEVLKAKKTAGIPLGRPKGPGKSILDPHKEEIIDKLKLGVPNTRIAKHMVQV